LRIEIITEDKKKYLDLLLLADEQEEMIDRYINVCEMFALFDDDLKGICVVTHNGDAIYEIRNLAVYEVYQRQGYGKKLVDYVLFHYRDQCKTMLVGTGDSPMTIPFYKQCGFEFSHRLKDYILQNYDHPIYECGKQLTDMVYLKRTYDKEVSSQGHDPL
jgi:GNAT superfamily N-acetyltransferase